MNIAHVYADGRHLTERMAERVVRRAARLAQVHKEVCCTTLRTSYAVARLRNGASIRELQQALGHKKL
ncbi:MAG: tyrosine-type recombinase/integrase, partial [Kiritimatiellae bacterium]|nr:tyrosine-type recombinase/integrase [Kiritimatiellia bacterium]